MRLIFSLLLVCAFKLVSFSQPAVGASDWKLRKNENGIVIYSRHQDGVPIDELKVVNVLDASLSAVAALILDADNYPSWIFRCTEARVISVVNEKEQYQYQKNDAPYPVSDRDIAVHFTLWQDAKTKIVYTHSEGVADYIPAVSGVVRMPQFDGGYVLTPLPNGKVEVVYTLMFDPGGSLPDWLINWSITTGPYETTLKMREEVLKPKYKDARLRFIVE